MSELGMPDSLGRPDPWAVRRARKERLRPKVKRILEKNGLDSIAEKWDWSAWESEGFMLTYDEFIELMRRLPK